jgi:putative transposase
MTDILALLQPIQNSVSKTTLRQLSRIIVAMIAMTGRVTMLGLSLWTEKGGSYRSVQRFFYTAIPWAQVFWVFFQVSFSAFSQSGCFRPHSSYQRACFFGLIGEGIDLKEPFP